MRECNHRDKCKVCKKCSACHAGPFEINEECEACLACEKIGRLTFRAPAAVRPQVVQSPSVEMEVINSDFKN